MFFLDDQETEKLSDVLSSIREALETKTLTVAKYKNIRIRASHVISTIWQEEIGKVYINDGKYEQFDYPYRGLLLAIHDIVPSIATFLSFREKMENLKIIHPIKNRMMEILVDMQQIVDMVEKLNEIDRTQK